MSIQAADIEARFKGTYSVSKEFIDLLVDLYANVESFNVEQFSTFELGEIYAYLKASHAYYIGDCMPSISEKLDRVESTFDGVESVQELKNFVKDYKAELYEHIEVEEQVILKFVQDILAGEYDQGNRDFFFNHFLHTHNDEIISSLNEIKSNVNKSDPEVANKPEVKSLFDTLILLKRDLEIHNLIEDEVFVLKTLDFVNSNFPQEANS